MMNADVIKLITGIGTVICLALILLKFLILIVNILKPRRHSIPYIRNYKKGSFISNYLIMLLIYFVGILYRDRRIFTSISSAIAHAIDIVALRLNTASIEMLMTDNRLYTLSVYLGYLLIVVGTVLFTVSVMQQHIWCVWKAFISKITKKEKLYLFGYNADNIAISQSDGNRRHRIFIDKISKEDRDTLYIENIPYVLIDPEKWLEVHISDFLRQGNNKNVVVINTGNDKKNIELCKCFVEAINSAPESLRDGIFSRLRIYVFGDPKYKAIYENMTKRGLGCINYINKYQKIAIDFIDRYPLSLFMNSEQIDYSTSLVREGVDINVALVGFGKTNREILLSSVASNQFITASETGVAQKPVKYFIFDKNKAEQNKNLNHEYYRLKKKLDSMDEDDYLPIPPLPAEEEYLYMDINDSIFYDSIKRVVSRNPTDANFIVIAFGDDLENLDMAEKLVEKCKEWDIDNVTIFVRAFEWQKEQTPIEDENCYFFGNEKISVFDIDKMLSDKLYRMAKIRSEMLDLERAITRQSTDCIDDNFIRENSLIANERWHKTKSQMQRDSSIFACLSLRFKLNLMGLDYCPTDAEGIPLSEDEYMRIYAGKDMPNTEKYNLRVNDKVIVYYGVDYPPSRRKNMAIQEHYRWTSFVISRGMVPATKEQIINETKIKNGAEVHTDGKNYALRRHGNITTFDGLVEFGRMIAARDGRSVECKDRIRYRYQILDDAYWLLTSNGYKIVKKISCRGTICDYLHGRPT